MNTNRKDIFRKAGILSLALFISVNSVISGSLIKLSDDLAIPLTSAEFLVTLASFSTIILILLNEKITRKIGMKRAVQVGLFFVGISGLIPLFFKSYAGVFASRLILGVGVGFYNGHSPNLINSFYEGDEAANLHGIRNSFEYLGQMILVFIAGIWGAKSWTYAFLTYSLAFLILGFFSQTVEEVDLEDSNDKLTINAQMIFYIIFAGIMIMNTTAVSIRFAKVASLSLSPDANLNMYMLILPIAGMISGFLFGYINRKLRSKTLLLGLVIYIITNISLGSFGENLIVYLAGMALLAFCQSLCTPYILAEVSRFVRGSSARLINNFIFVGVNLGGFFSSLYLNLITKIFSLKSPTSPFLSFIGFYIILFAIFFYEYLSVRSFRRV
ncbi:MFS transporter [uncultured Anaerococcus sp.]|uniref:MFS transporter n=1 Tax=uncultured Anaerococcus sp. TaxID=293428 RepID=UPI00261CEAC9|nr:MFS transporter [uncultured Anaerococcus sp.]